ncbi:MAG: hypothetical protein SPL47_02005, partial [Bacteroidales bacterium]|nr:hypothetical protein [Bacteroidales bacterium]
MLLSLHYLSSYHSSVYTTLYPCDGCIEYIPFHMQWHNFFNDPYSSEIFNISNPMYAVNGSSIDSLVVSYMRDDNGGKYFWVFNKSLRSAEDIVLNLNSGCSVADVLAHGRCTQNGSVAVTLQPGEAKLFRAFIENQLDTIKGNAVWNNMRLVGTTLVIDSMATLTVKDSLLFTPTARLIVRPGGKLLVDGGVLTSACEGGMWRGIEVMGNPGKRQEARHQGYVDLKNGAVVENALCAVLTGLQGDNGANSGGIIKAINTTFRNNARGVNILPYTYILPGGTVRGNIANFSYCNFIIDNDNNFSQNNTCFTEHVRLNDVSSVEFYSCSFSSGLLYNNLKTYRAIYAEDAGFIISKGCPDGLVFEDCVCPESFTPCNTFTGFNRAIEANTTGNQYEIRIDQSKFWRNGTGIKINGNNFVTVTRDSFDLTQGYGSRLGNRTGLFLNNCTGYKV